MARSGIRVASTLITFPASVPKPPSLPSPIPKDRGEKKRENKMHDESGWRSKEGN